MSAHGQFQLSIDNRDMPDDLLAPAVIRSVRVLVGSEVGGVQAAAFAKRHARNAAERAIWAALHELELQTRDAVFEQLGMPPCDSRLQNGLRRPSAPRTVLL